MKPYWDLNKINKFLTLDYKKPPKLFNKEKSKPINYLTFSLVLKCKEIMLSLKPPEHQAYLPAMFHLWVMVLVLVLHLTILISEDKGRKKFENLDILCK